MNEASPCTWDDLWIAVPASIPVFRNVLNSQKEVLIAATDGVSIVHLFLSEVFNTAYEVVNVVLLWRQESLHLNKLQNIDTAILFRDMERYHRHWVLTKHTPAPDVRQLEGMNFDKITTFQSKQHNSFQPDMFEIVAKSQQENAGDTFVCFPCWWIQVVSIDKKRADSFTGRIPG
uniref:Uncharacterized protein n=1 Tax=Timema tahoe TaxID=61484 RepID=A0A7R9FKZ6_9NEOP|nr:unnamed protein product [Timema tahoe]